MLRQLEPSKSSGPDALTNRVLRELVSKLASVLTTIFQESLGTGELPEDWRKANIVPIFKKGKIQAGLLDLCLLQTPGTRGMPTNKGTLGCEQDPHSIRAWVPQRVSCETQLRVTLQDPMSLLDQKI